MANKLVDPRSFELAEYFLADCDVLVEGRVMSLAEAIQEAVEDWYIEAREEEHIKERSRGGAGC
jgi:hypothetical protein